MSVAYKGHVIGATWEGYDALYPVAFTMERPVEHEDLLAFLRKTSHDFARIEGYHLHEVETVVDVASAPVESSARPCAVVRTWHECEARKVRELRWVARDEPMLWARLDEEN